MLVSILIANKDYSKFISTAIESALNQTYKDIEIVVCDDNSTDNSVEIIKQYLNQGVHLIKKRDGIPSSPSSRNACIVNSKGQYICFLDSDNYYNPNFIEEMVESLNNYDGIYCDYRHIKNGKIFRVNRLESYKTREELHKRYLAPACVICLNGVLIPRRVFDKVGLFNEKVLIGESIEFFIRATKYFYFKHIPKVLLNCRIHSTQQSSKLVHKRNWREISKTLGMKWLKEHGGS